MLCPILPCSVVGAICCVMSSDWYLRSTRWHNVLLKTSRAYWNYCVKHWQLRWRHWRKRSCVYALKHSSTTSGTNWRNTLQKEKVVGCWNHWDCITHSWEQCRAWPNHWMQLCCSCTSFQSNRRLPVRLERSALQCDCI